MIELLKRLQSYDYTKTDPSVDIDMDSHFFGATIYKTQDRESYKPFFIEELYAERQDFAEVMFTYTQGDNVLLAGISVYYELISGYYDEVSYEPKYVLIGDENDNVLFKGLFEELSKEWKELLDSLAGRDEVDEHMRKELVR